MRGTGRRQHPRAAPDGTGEAAPGVRPAARHAGTALPGLGAGAAGHHAWRAGATAAVLPAAGPLRWPDRIRTGSRVEPGAAVSAAPVDSRPGGLPGRARWWRAAVCITAGTRRPCGHGSGGGTAGARTRAGDAVRTGARAAGTGAATRAGARPAPAGARVAAVRAGR